MEIKTIKKIESLERNIYFSIFKISLKYRETKV